MAADLLHALDICKGLHSHILASNKAPFVINREQCMLLSQRLLKVEEELLIVQDKLKIIGSQSLDVVPVVQELVHVLLKAQKTVVKDCFCGEKWIESALRQGGDLKETFGEILYDLQWLCSILLKEVGLDSQPLSLLLCDRFLGETQEEVNTLLTAAKKDQEDLKGLLRDLKGDHSCCGQSCNVEHTSMQCLATQLLEKLEFQAHLRATAKKNFFEYLLEEFKNLSEWPSVLLVNKQDIKTGSLLGAGSYGTVHEADWCGEPYVIKNSKYGYHGLLKQEIAALSGVHHPHNMHLVCCVEEEKSCSYVMERMNKSLSKLLEDNQLSLIRRVDIMLQIAEGINFLHSMGLVHRDLKPDNILMKCDGGGFESSTSAPVGEPLWIAKVCDFGTTKAKMESTAYANQTLPIGTLMYMAPEVYKLESADEVPERFHPSKTDVYSFGLICYAVLIWEPTPFPTEEVCNPSVREFKARVRTGIRPQLPTDCPFRLSTLIRQCWDGNPLMRPNFQNVCQELRYIKGLLLAGSVGRKQVGDNPLDVESSVASPNLLDKTIEGNLSQRRVPRFYYFTTIGETQTLVTKLMPTMQVVELHVLCECKMGSHVVVGQEGCEVIIKDQEREIIQSLMVQGQKRIFLAIKASPAYVTLKVGNMVVPIEANTDFMGAMQGLANVKFDENLVVGEQWLANFLRDKEIRRAFSLEGVMYMDGQGQAIEFAWLCKQHLVEGLQSRTLCQLPRVEKLESRKFKRGTAAILAAN
ncbi:unnamed protein product [Sphagnum balticum]